MQKGSKTMNSAQYKDFQEYIDAATVKYNTENWFRTRSDYYDEYISNELDDKMIFYEAFFGRGITCNPGALFRYLLNDGRFSDYTHVWSLENSEDNEITKARYANYDNVIFVESFSREYFKYLSRAKYLINNVTFQSYFIKKEGQVVINTWHGIPLKNLGYDIPDNDVSNCNTLRNFIMSDYIISPVPYTTENFRKAFKLEGIFQGNIVETGYPRTDSTVNFDKNELKRELDAFGIPYDESKKLILYAPTWKGHKYGAPDFVLGEYEKFLNLLYSKIDTEKYQILFKPHQIVYKKMVESGNIKKEYVPAGIDTNLLLGGTDILISDYSSIFFDFLVTGRPVLFYIPDLDEYKTSRGLYIHVDELPGPTTQSALQIAEWISKPEELDGIIDREKYQKTVDNYVCNDDGCVCKRIVDTVFFGNSEHCIELKNNKIKLLLHTDAILVNGISFSAFNLMNNIDTDKYDVTFFSQGDRNFAQSYINGLPETIRAYFKPGAQCANIEAMAKLEYCKENAIVELSSNNEMFPSELFKGEYKRCFGDAKFDIIADFTGYSSYFANVFFTNKECKKVIWMHNVMRCEYAKIVDGVQIFKNHLDCVYQLYPGFDKYISCSKTTMLENRKDLATEETYSRFSYAKNLIDYQRVYNGAESKEYATLDGEKYIYINDKTGGELLIPAPRKEDINFVTVGRLAEAKNHFNLIEAFKRFNDENPDSRLYIIGDGPLASKTARLISSLSLKGKVILVGSTDNPFAIMSACDCFILPSLFEGQPVVILEARTLGLPIIVSDFDTVADSIYENGQLVIKTDAHSIYEALVKFKNNEVPNEYKFDPVAYNREAMAEFEEAISI